MSEGQRSPSTNHAHSLTTIQLLDDIDYRHSRCSIFVGDTIDGGLMGWLMDAGGMDIRLQSRNSQKLDWDDFDDMKEDAWVPGTTSPVPLRCHCGDLRLNLVPDSQRRFPVAVDTCKSCRLTTGHEIVWWAYSLPEVFNMFLTMPDGSPFDISTQSRSLTRYASSPGRYRYFCGRCGATAFRNFDGKPITDVAIGLLDAESGARAEEIIDWDEWRDRLRVDHADEASDWDFANFFLVSGWQLERGASYPHHLPTPLPSP